MYEYLKGVLAHIHPTYIVVDCHGVGYCIFVANPFQWQGQLGTEVTFYVYHVVREDFQALYGFGSYDEKQLFTKLLSVSGIGPKSALSILAHDNQQSLVQAIEQNDVQFLTKFPGVGKKTAAQIVLDLRGKLSHDFTAHTVQTGRTDNRVFDETEEALLGLGYRATEIKRIMPKLKAQTFETTEEALRQAFKLLLEK